MYEKYLSNTLNLNVCLSYLKKIDMSENSFGMIDKLCLCNLTTQIARRKTLGDKFSGKEVQSFSKLGLACKLLRV